MSSVLQFLLALMVVIGAAKIAGLLSRRLGQPAVLGQILAGLLLGPSLINLYGLPFMNDAHLPETISLLAELGVIFLMFIAGLEVDLGQMRRAGSVVLLSGSFGVIVPLLMGAATALLFGFTPNQSLFIGMLLTATSVSISAQTLLELGVLRSRVGIALLGAAVVDDVLVILLLSGLLAIEGSSSGLLGIVLLVVRMLIYLGLFSLLGWLLVPRILAWADRAPISEGLLTATVVMMIFYAWAAEALGGIALITGAFLAGVVAASSPLKLHIEEGMHRLTYAFFVPIFFVNIGLGANVRDLQGSLIWFTIALVLVAVISKVIGCGSGALVGGFRVSDAARLGTGMISRGEVGLIVASLAAQNGLIPNEILSVAVILVLITTLVTPPLLRVTFRHSPAPAEPKLKAAEEE